MKNDNALKKHHFWILLGLVPLLTLIGVLVVQGSVGGAITKRQGEIASAQSGIAGKQNPKSEKAILEAGKFFDVVSKKQGDLHKVNWERQKHLYTWPANAPLLKEIEARGLKFGDPLPNDRGEFNQLQNNDVYIREFSSVKQDGVGTGVGMADRVAPTQFYGTWRRVLRYVNDFGQVSLTKDQVWLIMEDIWVQRSMLDAVRAVNEEMSSFHRAKHGAKDEIVEDPTYDDFGNKIAVRNGQTVVVPTPPDEKKKALFKNRTWAVELELVNEGDTKRLTGTLTNLTDRLQLMGLNDTMTLHVWFTRQPTEQPTVFKIGGAYLRGKGALKRGPDGKEAPDNSIAIVPTPDHLLPAGKTAEEIVRVEHVFDIRTVPIKRIDRLVIGNKLALDSRNAEAVLVGPPTPPFAKEPEAAPTDPNAGTTGGVTGTGSSLGPPGGMGGSSLGPPGGITAGMGNPMSGQTAGRVKAEGGGPITEVIDGNKKRYLEVTPQVRRMPVAIVVVVDQAYMQDVLLAFANSPLRFQITQVAWTRFRGSLGGNGAAGAAGGNTEDIESGRGQINFGGSGDPDAPGSSLGPRPPGILRPGGPPGTGSALGPPPTMPGMMGSPSGYGPPGLSSGSALIASESQLTSGLVELSIYGIVSLYEKYTEAPKDGDKKDGDKKDDKPAGPPAPAPGPATAPGPTTPKMRRRVRR